jgi:hypothetical protein
LRHQRRLVHCLLRTIQVESRWRVERDGSGYLSWAVDVQAC